MCSAYLWCLQFMKTSKCDLSIINITIISSSLSTHHFFWSILIMVFGGFWGIYIENFLLGRFEKNEAQSPVIVTDLWLLMIVWIFNFVCKWWWVLLSLPRIYELCIIVWIDKILLTYNLCMWNNGIYWCMNWYRVFLCYSSQYIYNISLVQSMRLMSYACVTYHFPPFFRHSLLVEPLA